jgi:hypothetical protein
MMTTFAEPVKRTTTDVNYAATLVPKQFPALFDRLSRRDDLLCTIQVAGDTVGGTGARSLPLDSITYEDGGDQVAILLGGRQERYPAALTHYVRRPRTVEVVGHDDLPHRLTIVGVDGTRTELLFDLVAD